MTTRTHLVGLLTAAGSRGELEVTFSPFGIAQAIKHLPPQETIEYLTMVLAAAVYYGKTGQLPTTTQLEEEMG
ncbi:MAG: hypothetical protein A3B90_02230 [Candidatus Magasanikbacteria bacterium RIFCSPHIGHO2_02_FULL_41_13]|uniref:Uncharacterized protein n=1 Tax=Candidatus Magasanikbacteria bacterium RIFCSPHIGHO2_02_FULL_41_13 TaxID=1798676 RepID=A0A1F6M3L6_9BACT|nr:MAG: hypothetical protein A3B90_02230 [Candidatus Magasanikbacteria bacterium RIFCSPHIGHO2_02_FULL_41_13]